MHPVAGRPQVVAHRGASHSNAEHTLGAYVQALDEGAEGLECDVRLTADGHLVCVHDRRVDRVANARGVVSTMALAQLDELDFASWKNPWVELDDEAPDIDVQARRVLTMRKLLEMVRDYDRPVDLAIETKHPTRYGGQVEQRLIELLARHGMLRPHAPVMVMSFATSALRRVRLLAPELPRVQLMGKVPLLYRDGSLPLGANVAGPSIEILRAHPRYVQRVQATGRQVYVWTVDEPADIDLVIGLGVDAIITNRPADVLAHLGRQAS